MNLNRKSYLKVPNVINDRTLYSKMSPAPLGGCWPSQVLGTGGQCWMDQPLAETSRASCPRNPSSPRRPHVSWASPSSSSLLRMRSCCPQTHFQVAHLPVLLGLESGTGREFQTSSQNYQMLFLLLRFLFPPSAPM